MNNICVYDLETSSADPKTTQILQLGGIILDRNNLSIVDRFESLFKPTDFSTLEEEALKVNRLKVEDLEKAPETPIVWQQFVAWVGKYNIHKNKSTFGACIQAGYNINNFDAVIINRYCEMYGPFDKKRKQQKIFNQVQKYDVMDILQFFTESNQEVTSLSLGNILEYMGVSEEERHKAHNAMIDVLFTAAILIKLLKAGRYLTAKNEDGKRRLTMKDALKGWKPT
jgi:DNA polymerase III epsilon subunit-like protein